MGYFGKERNRERSETFGLNFFSFTAALAQVEFCKCSTSPHDKVNFLSTLKYINGKDDQETTSLQTNTTGHTNP